MINYEVMLILDPALEDDRKDATVETVKGIIARQCRHMGNEKTRISYPEEI